MRSEYSAPFSARQTGQIGRRVSKWWGLTLDQPPMITEGHPGGTILPVGEGMTATQLA